jgi:Arc/MetJ-type ribon-helix-helix transcriptional regulator
MNTCESTDREHKTIRIGNKIVGLSPAYETKTVHAVRDIGAKLNAISYVGWDCTVERQVSVNVPNMLMEELDTKIVDGEYQLRSPSEAVTVVTQQLDENGGMDAVFSGKLRCLVKEGAFERVIDGNKEPN